jgi:DNA-binding FrmR family transcriptional regulator
MKNTSPHLHASHPHIVKRLRRAEGHLHSILAMFENERSCVELAQQLHAVEKAVANAKRELIHDHIEHCLEEPIVQNPKAARASLAELKTLAKYL